MLIDVRCVYTVYVCTFEHHNKLYIYNYADTLVQMENFIPFGFWATLMIVEGRHVVFSDSVG